mgnify:FL=1
MEFTSFCKTSTRSVLSSFNEALILALRFFSIIGLAICRIKKYILQKHRGVLCYHFLVLILPTTGRHISNLNTSCAAIYNFGTFNVCVYQELSQDRFAIYNFFSHAQHISTSQAACQHYDGIADYSTPLEKKFS